MYSHSPTRKDSSLDHIEECLLCHYFVLKNDYSPVKISIYYYFLRKSSTCSPDHKLFATETIHITVDSIDFSGNAEFIN